MTTLTVPGKPAGRRRSVAGRRLERLTPRARLLYLAYEPEAYRTKVLGNLLDATGTPDPDRLNRLAARIADAVDAAFRRFEHTGGRPIYGTVLRERLRLYGPDDAPPRSCGDIAEEFGLTAPKIRGLQVSALRYFRHPWITPGLIEIVIDARARGFDRTTEVK